MRKTVLVILASSFFIYACKKNPNTPAPAPGNGGAITITSISPAIPYADDEITITGTGFNVDKTKDTVDFGTGDPVSGIFLPYVQGAGNSSKTVIVSATATQLVIKSVNPDSTASGLDYQLFKSFNIGQNASNRLRVRSNGIKAISNLVPFKQLPQIVMETTADQGVWQASNTLMRPNDSVSVFLYGANTNGSCDNKVTLSCNRGGGCTFVDSYLTLNGISPQCNCDDFGTTVYGCGGTTFQGKLISYTASTHIANIHFLVPATFFNTPVNTGSSSRILIKMQYSNPDGKSNTKPVVCWAYPNH